MQQHQIESAATSAGDCVVLVALTNSPEWVEIERADLERITEAFGAMSFYLNGDGKGRQYPSVHVSKPFGAGAGRARRVMPPVSLARLVVSAGRGRRVHYRDGNRLNLRRENLALCGGASKHEAIAG